MEGRGDGRCSGYRIPLDLGRGEPNLRFRRFCISLHSDEISFIIEAAPRQPQNDNDNNDDEANLDDIDDEANAEDNDNEANAEDNDNEANIEENGDAVAEDSDSEHDVGDGDGNGQNEDSDSDLILDDNDEFDNFVNTRDQYAWIRFIWQVWPFSCGNIFEEIVFEFHGIREEDLAIRDYDIAQENVDDNDNNANDVNNEQGDNHDVEDAANDNELQVSVNQALEQVDEHPLPLPVPTIPNVRSKVQEIDEALRWWHEFDYNFSESTGIDVDEEEPLPTGCEKRTRENAQDGTREKSGLQVNLNNEPDCGIRSSDLVEEEEASGESEFVSGFSELESEADPLPGPSRKRSRDEAGLNRETRSNKRFCRRSECDGKASDSSAEGSLSGGATKWS